MLRQGFPWPWLDRHRFRYCKGRRSQQLYQRMYLFRRQRARPNWITKALNQRVAGFAIRQRLQVMYGSLWPSRDQIVFSFGQRTREAGKRHHVTV